MPDMLRKLQRLFLIEATKYNVIPLDDRGTERFVPEIAGRPTLIRGNSQLFFPGMGRLSENSVVSIKNKSFSVTAEVEVGSKPAHGVIIAQGGRFGGWTLYLKDGVLKYVHNYLGITEYPVVATEPLPVGRATVQFKFTYEGGDKTGQGGTGALYVGNKKVGEAHIDKTVPFMYSFDETLDIGRDPATPVTKEYTMGDNAFNGKIYSVTIDIGKNAVAYYEPPENIMNRVMFNQ
jgi:arylsulfatase